MQQREVQTRSATRETQACGPPAARSPNLRVAWHAALMLAAANSLAFVDRQVLALLVPPVEADLHISDTKMSLLLGLSFTVLQALAGLPLGRLADAANRRNIVAAAVFLWSVMTGLCGLAGAYWSMFAARIGIGAAEAGLTPAAHSMLADYFPRERLPAAMALYSMGIYVGNGLALLAGGWIVAIAVRSGMVFGVASGWRVVFLVLGVSGMLFAAVLMTVREPRRRQVADAQPLRVPLRLVWQQLRSHRRVYASLFAGFCVMIMVGVGTGAWIPTFFVRRFGWTLAEVGTYYGSAVLVFGTAGAWCGGLFAGALRRRGWADANLRASLFGFVMLVPFAVAYPLVPDPFLAVALVAGYNFFAGFPFGGGYAAIQEITPSRMRGQVAAIFALLVNIIGQGAGPTLVALFTNYLFADERGLQKSLALTAALAMPVAIASLWSGLSHYGRSHDEITQKSTPA
jgi:MFS family permease